MASGAGFSVNKAIAVDAPFQDLSTSFFSVFTLQCVGRQYSGCKLLPSISEQSKLKNWTHAFSKLEDFQVEAAIFKAIFRVPE